MYAIILKTNKEKLLNAIKKPKSINTPINKTQVIYDIIFHPKSQDKKRKKNNSIIIKLFLARH